MPCCGNHRRAAANGLPIQPYPQPAHRALASRNPVEFEYRGRTSLTAVGSVTRNLYWFAKTGARVLVDTRDAPALDGITNLVRAQSLTRIIGSETQKR
jgi:hypothetical protein